MPRKPEHTARFRVEFDRIGRNHNVAPLELEIHWGANTNYPDQDGMTDALADRLYREVRGKLASQGVEVHVFDDENTGALQATIIVGIGHCGGRGTITRLEEPAVTP